MDTLIIEGVRCFSELQTVRLRPITLLTGENSTGKSTVLALVRIAWDLFQSIGCEAQEPRRTPPSGVSREADREAPYHSRRARF